MAMIYKVSYVVSDRSHPGAIVNEVDMPEPGTRIEIGDRVFEVLEVYDMMPPRGDFRFLHATVKPVDDAAH